MTDIFMLFCILLLVVIVSKINEKSLDEDIIETYGQACCIDGECHNLIKEQCLARGGDSFKGKCDSVNCAQHPHPNGLTVKQACCINNECYDYIKDVCLSSGGDFFSGKCEDESCEDRFRQAKMEFACCINGRCELVTNAKCANLMGDFYASRTCEQVLCNTPEPEYACCINGRCELVTNAKCANLMGDFYASRTCEQVLCNTPEPEYACCINGRCELVTNAKCANLMGDFYASRTCEQVLCNTPEPEYACCINGRCELVTNAKCANLMGDFYASRTCEQVLCNTPEPEYACCINGRCEMMTNAKCANLMGDIFASITCEQVLCDTSVPGYACCINGDCAELTMRDCESYNGDFSVGENCRQVECLKNKGEWELPVELFNLVRPFDNVIFLVDNSSGMGSAYWSGGTKWDFVKNTIRLWMEYLPIKEAAVVVFNQKISKQYPGYDYKKQAWHLKKLSNLSSSARRKEINVFVEKLGTSTGGSTDIGVGFERALKHRTTKGKPIDAIIFFSDGEPTQIGINETIKKLKEHGADTIPIHVVATGNYFIEKSKNFFRSILKLNKKNSWRGTDGVLRE